MNSSQYDVIVVGAGAAGLTAAIGLARAGFTVAVLEAAAFPGAENWSGCVYFCENLAHPDILGPAGVDSLAWERRLVERGFFATDGHSLMGMTYRDPAAFRHCYTVLRPVFDHHLAQVALRHGVALLNETTVESLIRERNRVIGVCTNRGALYADLVFLAEGDASHLVTREGYERFTDPREAPKFLQGIKQVIELPPGAVEEIFDVGPDEGAAYEMLLRNGSLRGRPVHLNMGGFVYTNRQSLSIGLVLPVDNLHDHFGGDPNLLMEWFSGLAALRPWLREGKRGVFGAKLIRGGGAKDIPHLVDHGLAIGGAASAIGIDFPYPNFTGPATAMGLLLVQAACRIREERCDFTSDNLRRHYLEPLQRTHYWQDVEFLRRWPGYVKRTRVFFDRGLDLALGSAYIWTRPNRWFITKWMNWLRLLLLRVAGPGHWDELRNDLRHLVRALRLREITDRPSAGRLLLDGTVNALRDFFGKARPNLPPAGIVRLHYAVAGGAEASGLPPALVHRWFRRFAPILASAARRVYTNDDVSLLDKLPGATRLIIRQINILDLLGAGALALSVGCGSALLAGWDRLRGLFGRRRKATRTPGLYRGYSLASRRAGDLTPFTAPAAQSWEARLARLAYETSKTSHIHVLWPRALPEKNAVAAQGLWHVCPAHVYEARVSPDGQVQVVVNFENCIKCETCWRASGLVDWGRDGQQRFVYPVQSPAVSRLLDAVNAVGLARPALPRATEPWGTEMAALAQQLQADPPASLNGQDVGLVTELRHYLGQIERKLQEFDESLAEEPRTVDRARAEYLEMLARYAQQLALRVVEELRPSFLADPPNTGKSMADQRLLELATALRAKAEERSRRTWDQRFSWAAADGRQLRQHHLPGLRGLLGVLAKQHGAGSPVSAEPVRAWLRAEEDGTAVAGQRAEWSARLDAVFGPSSWRELERQVPFTSEQDAVLRDLVARVPALHPDRLKETLHPPLRKALLAELGRRDPSLAYRVASHLWARDLATLASGSSWLGQAAAPWAAGDEWACFTVLDAVETRPGGAVARWQGEALFVPARGVRRLLLLLRDRLVVVPADHPGLKIEPLATLGLRGAGLAGVQLDGVILPDTQVSVDYNRMRRVWSILSAADLTSIACGMAGQLCERAVAHAISRVQFPGLFHDEMAHDTIGKFGAVKKMIAEMEARRYLIETLDYNLSPTDFSSSSLDRSSLVKVLVAEALGTAPGSLSYNAGQVFGGTGYSEDDILAKYYRDAAAWRFLGPSDSEINLRHGQFLLSNWRADGHRLAHVAEEVQLFEQVAQRNALQAELDEVRNARSRLKVLVGDWQAAQKPAGDREADPQGVGATPAFVPGGQGPAAAEGSAEVAEALARQDARLLASKALLLRTHARLEQGLNAQVEMALLRVWLEEASNALEEFEGAARRHLEPAGRCVDRPVVEPAAPPPVTTYEGYLAAPAAYDSGDFLTAPVDLTQPRFVPEMIEADARLAGRDRHFRELLAGYFGRPRDGGLLYERYIERQHRPDAADLDFCRRHGFFRMPIPQDLGGEGAAKVDYYLLTTNAQRLADVAISLTIQANTSIGTTPVLLARDKDLPRAQKELAAFIGAGDLQREIHGQLETLTKMLASPDPKAIKEQFLKAQKRLGETVLARPVLKVLAHRFLECWQQAGRAGEDFDLAAMKGHLGEALARWRDACGRAEELHGELGRRREACDQFLRWVAAGQISAFALTEPSAGSDTARVATRARLRSVAVDRDADGVLSFVPAGGKEMRYLLDARRLEFRTTEGGEREVYYRWSETAEPARVHFDEYDYETDDAKGLRYYGHGGRRIAFTDVAQLREREGGLYYDYWELTGAKMWITNGRMAGVMALYAKTEEGVTGFMVDRHAEGLIVGKDEAKMGQCGSPTNELSLQSVRVPRENVLGLEGRGQVNALETLNVGRAGLAMSAMAQLQGLIDASRACARERHGEIPAWVGWRLQRMEEDCFTAEALAHDVIGRFEHPQTKSVRMESAIAKLLVSELLHRTIELAEEVHGLAGQTQRHLVEKRKRDARILNIYEGTNEVQRFFILKDLASEVAPRWSRTAPAAPQHLGREALELEALKRGTRQRIEAALALFGQQLWQNPNLQANCFLLADVVAWLKAAESTLGRLAWLSRQAPSDEDAEPSPKMDLARRALARAHAEVEKRLRRFDEELTHLRRGYYAPEVRAASLLFQRAATTQPADWHPRSDIRQPLSILVVVEPSAGGVPHPQVEGGRLLEPHFTLTEADRSALETALRLRDEAGAPVAIDVAAVGPPALGQVLRGALSLGVDRARLVVCDSDPVTPASAAAALAAVLGPGARHDLILSGGMGQATEEGLVAQLTAAALGVPYAGAASRLGVQATQADSSVLLVSAENRQRVRPLPAMVGVEAGIALRPFTVAGYLAGLAKAVEVHRWPRRVTSRPAAWVAAVPQAATAGAEQPPHPLTPQQAAGEILDELGLQGTSFTHAAFQGEIEDVSHPSLLDAAGPSKGRVLAVLSAEATGLRPSAAGVLRAAGGLAGFLEADLAVLLLAPEAEPVQRQILGQLMGLHAGQVVVVPTASASEEVKNRLLVECWPALGVEPAAVVGESWAGAAFAGLASRPDKPGTAVLQVRRLAEDGDGLVVETSRAQGKLRVRQPLPSAPGNTWWLTMEGEVEVSGSSVPPQPAPQVQRWSPRLERFYGRHEIQRLLDEVKQETGVVRLGDADFILDVGFGVGNRDGYEAVVEPLEKALRRLGVRNLVIGGSRKVTEELHLLPADRQIGQSGVRVNPQVLIAIGISGAPQHLNYIGPRATILAFNRDPEAPLMTLNKRQARPRVFAVIGDLFETVPALTAALMKEQAGQVEFAAEPVNKNPSF